MSGLAASKQHGLGALRNILATGRAILSEALEDGLIASNPAARLGRFVFGGARKRAVEFLTREEAQRFLASAKVLRPHRYPLFLTVLRSASGLVSY
jgi:hypothetical protein